jgi:predicted ATPase
MRGVRERLHLSQEQVAQLVGVSFATLDKWENHRSRPSRAARERLERWLSEASAAGQRPGSGRPARLPADATPFVGRARERTELLALWPDCRMLTLTGAGGVGKSRLGIELIRRTAAHVLGVVRLDMVRDPALTLAEVAAGLGVHARPGQAESDVILGAVRDASGVLLLDTCEHVAGSLRPLLRQLLEAAPAIQVLATSQVPLAVPGEQVWRVPGLGLPAGLASRPPRVDDEVTPEAAARCDAVQFFLARTRQRAPVFVPGPAALLDIAQICIRLDGIPLALGLAAAWMGAASPAELLRRWEDRAELLADATAEPERHRTLQSAIQWSADLLTSDDQALVAHLSAFIGPFTIADAEAVGTGLSDARLLTGLRRLVDVSWLDFVPDSRQPHYVILDPLRDWGADELAKRGQSEVVWRLHAEHFRRICRQAEADRFHTEPGDWPWRLGLLAGNIQVALARCVRLAPETGAESGVEASAESRRSA